MKPTTLIVPMLLLSCAVFANESAPIIAAQEREFHDPFASDSGSSKSKVSDPLEPLNRTFFHFNNWLYRRVLRPFSSGYRTVAPKPVRVCVDRFFINLKFPVRVVNNVLEARFKGAGIETARFVVNSTVGVAGLFDPATHWKLKEQSADFDQTLTVYRIPNGIYLNWPVLGPSTVRGTVGMAGDSALNPLWYVDVPLAVTAGATGLKVVNTTSLHIDEYNDLMSATLDPYAAERSAYLEIHGNASTR